MRGAGITVTLPKPMTSNAKAEGRFGKQDFRYVAEEDFYVCPADEKLTYHYTIEEKGLVLRRYWTNACQTCAIKHRRTTAKERRITRWEHEHSRSGSTPARRTSGEDAPATGDGRASLWHHQGPDGRNPLPDEDVATGRRRDGAARPGLQPHPRHEHHGHPAAHGGDEGIAEPKKCSHIAPGQDRDASRLPVMRFYTTKTHRRHRSPYFAVTQHPPAEW